MKYFSGFHSNGIKKPKNHYKKLFLLFEPFQKSTLKFQILSINSVSVCVCVSIFDEWTNERMTFLDDGGEGGSYSSKPSLSAQHQPYTEEI